MILSHKNKFIFLKTTKTGGTSLEIALSRFCGPDDIITPISPEDEVLRQELGYRGPQNYKISLYRGALHYGRYRKWPRFYNHMSATEVIRLVGRPMWNEYFTFCFERNPWERVLSFFHWRNRLKENVDLQTFIQSSELNRLKRRGSQLYKDHDEQILVDRICRYENYEQELAELTSILHLEEPLAAPRAKGNIRPKRQEAVFTQQDIDYLGRFFSSEIEQLGYQYEGDIRQLG